MYREVDIALGFPILLEVSEDRSQPKKTLKDRVEEVVQSILEGLAELIPSPEPQLIPVRVRRPPYPRRRR